MMQQSDSNHLQLLGRQGARRSILRNTVPPVKRSSTVTWDESKIAEHDKDRGTRTTIDEPKTPFMRANSNEEFTDEYAKETGSTQSTLTVEEASAGGVDPAEVASRLTQLTEPQSIGTGTRTGSGGKPRLLKGMSFEERRKAHYLTEFNRAKNEVENP
eukprot:Lankesteria_metandrocarpae@DN633_c0_g1_i1.p1